MILLKQQVLSMTVPKAKLSTGFIMRYDEVEIESCWGMSCYLLLVSLKSSAIFAILSWDSDTDFYKAKKRNAMQKLNSQQPPSLPPRGSCTWLPGLRPSEAN